MGEGASGSRGDGKRGTRAALRMRGWERVRSILIDGLYFHHIFTHRTNRRTPLPQQPLLLTSLSPGAYTQSESTQLRRGEQPVSVR